MGIWHLICLRRLERNRASLPLFFLVSVEFKNQLEVILDRCLEKDRIFLGEIGNALGGSEVG